MKKPRYSDDFKLEAVKQVLERGYSQKDVAQNLGISVNSLFNWIKKYGDSNHKQKKILQDKDAEIARLKSELKRTKEERDILKKAAAYFANHLE